MRIIRMMPLVILFLALHCCAQAQQADTTVIRELELVNRQAVLKLDTTALYRIFAPEMIVNTPANFTATLPMVKRFFRLGQIDYTYFDIDIEKISIVENVAIVTGQEVVKPQGNSDYVGKKVTRRYTDVYMKRNGNWQMIGRQATVATIE